MRAFSSVEFIHAAYLTRTLMIQTFFVIAFWIAGLGVKMLPKNHPLRSYHAYARTRIRTIYIKSAEKTR